MRTQEIIKKAEFMVENLQVAYQFQGAVRSDFAADCADTEIYEQERELLSLQDDLMAVRVRLLDEHRDAESEYRMFASHAASHPEAAKLAEKARKNADDIDAQCWAVHSVIDAISGVLSPAPIPTSPFQEALEKVMPLHICASLKESREWHLSMKCKAMASLLRAEAQSHHEATRHTYGVKHDYHQMLVTEKEKAISAWKQREEDAWNEKTARIWASPFSGHLPVYSDAPMASDVLAPELVEKAFEMAGNMLPGVLESDEGSDMAFVDGEVGEEFEGKFEAALVKSGLISAGSHPFIFNQAADRFEIRVRA